MSGVRRVVPGALIMIALLFFLFPVVWMVLTSFKTQTEYFANPPLFLPHSFDLKNYVNALAFPPDGRGGLQGLRDSLIIAIGSTAASVVIGSLAAYGFARFRTGGENLSFWVLSTRMFPPVASALPLFLLFRQIHLLRSVRAQVIQLPRPVVHPHEFPVVAADSAVTHVFPVEAPLH